MVDSAVFKIYTVTMGKKPLDVLKTGLQNCKVKFKRERIVSWPVFSEKRRFLLKTKNGLTMMQILSMKKLSLTSLTKPLIMSANSPHWMQTSNLWFRS